jgi:hypothetical protein
LVQGRFSIPDDDALHSDLGDPSGSLKVSAIASAALHEYENAAGILALRPPG